MTPLAWLWYNTTINPAGGEIQIGGHFFMKSFTKIPESDEALAYVRPQSQWRKRCAALLKTADLFILHGMGVPIDWQTRQLWEDACK